MIRFTIAISFVLLFINAQSQRALWKGKVLDESTGEAVPGALIMKEGTNYGCLSDSDGSFVLDFPFKGDLTFNVNVLTHENKAISLNEEDFREIKDKDDKTVYSLNRDILLSRKFYEIDDVVITPDPVPPDTIYGEDEFHVGDYAFLNKGYTLLLTYDKQKRFKRENEAGMDFHQDCDLVLLDKYQRVVDKFSLGDETCIDFYTEYPGLVILNTKSKKYLITQDSEMILVEEITDEDFESFIKPVVDTLDNLVFISSFTPEYPAFEYYIYDQLDSSYHVLHSVVDEHTMEMFRAEYKYMDPRDKLEAYRYELKTGVDKEVVAAYMTGFTSNIYYNELYAPIFVNGDTVMVFDHYSDQLYKYDKDFTPIDSVEISHHKRNRARKWKKELIYDEVTGSVYAIFEQDNYLNLFKVDPTSGEQVFVHRLYYKFAEKLKIRDNKLHYIYRPFESSQKKFLYREFVISI